MKGKNGKNGGRGARTRRPVLIWRSLKYHYVLEHGVAEPLLHCQRRSSLLSSSPTPAAPARVPSGERELRNAPQQVTQLQAKQVRLAAKLTRCSWRD